MRVLTGRGVTDKLAISQNRNNDCKHITDDKEQKAAPYYLGPKDTAIYLTFPSARSRD